MDLRWEDLGPILSNDIHVIPIEGRLALLERLPGQLQVGLSAHWLDALAQPPFAETKAVMLDELGIVSDDSGASILTDTFPPGGCRSMSLTATGFSAPRASSAGGIFAMFGGSTWGFVKLQIGVTVIASSLTLALLLIGEFLMRRHRDPRYGFGNDVVRLGSLLRRAVARLIDSLLIAIPSWTILGWAMWKWGFDPMQIIDAFLTDWRQALVTVLLVVLGAMAYFLFIVVLLGTMEGWYGCTPGKLLCGLRVCRTTLVRCGALRGIMRQLLLMLDGLFNYIVGIALIAFLPKCQRLGDLAMDTIVVDAASLPRQWNE
jgi:uncharacterized RDD family membrane protein YckC